MAKESPWFKFRSSEYNDGIISLCSFAAQGLFTNLISLYWSREGDLSLTLAKRKYATAPPELWTELIEEKVIKIDEAGDLSITFLDEQLSTREEISEARKLAAKARWDEHKKQQKEPKNANAMQMHSKTKNGALQHEKPAFVVVSNIERERDNKIPIPETPVKGVVGIEKGVGTKTPSTTPQPLWRVGLRDGLVLHEVWGKYGEFLAEKMGGMDRPRLEKAWLNFWPKKLDDRAATEFRNLLKTIREDLLRTGIEDIALLLTFVGQEGPKSLRIADFDDHIKFFNDVVE